MEPPGSDTSCSSTGAGKPERTRRSLTQRLHSLQGTRSSARVVSRTARSDAEPSRPRRAWEMSVATSRSGVVRFRRMASSTAWCTRAPLTTPPRSSNVRSTPVTGMPRHVVRFSDSHCVVRCTMAPRRRGPLGPRSPRDGEAAGSRRTPARSSPSDGSPRLRWTGRPPEARSPTKVDGRPIETPQVEPGP